MKAGSVGAAGATGVFDFGGLPFSHYQVQWNAMSITIPSQPFLIEDEQNIDLFPVPSELTVAQTAEFLRTTERHVNDMLDAGKFKFRQEDGERLVLWSSLVAHVQWRERGRAWLAEEARENQELGLYDMDPYMVPYDD
jgi:hypothetical protein